MTTAGASRYSWFAALAGTWIVSASDWDLFGLSFYPFYGTGATLANLSNTLDTLDTLNTLATTCGKPLQVAETDWTAICNGSKAPVLSDTTVRVNAEGQTDWVEDVTNVLKQVPNGLGHGVHYWEPARLNNAGLGGERK